MEAPVNPLGRRLFAAAGSEAGGEAGLLTLLNDLKEQDVYVLWIIVGLLVLINFLWEFCTDFLEHIFWHKNRHIIVMLEKLYKELTIVGIWSVGLFVLSSTFGVSNPTLKHIFELIHISLFGLVLLYIGVMVFMVFQSIFIFRKFHTLEELDQREVERNYEKDRKEMKEKGCFRIYMNPWKVWKRSRNKSTHHYYTFRDYFIKQLDLTDSFHFDAYLKRAMKATFTEWAQIHWSVLAVVLVSQLAIWIAFITVIPGNRATPFCVLIFLCLMFFLTLHMKIDMVYMDLKENPDIWAPPSRSRYEEAEDRHQESKNHRTTGKDDEKSFDIEMDGMGDSSVDPHHKPDFHLRVHEESSDSDSDSDKHRNTRKRPNYRHGGGDKHYSSSDYSSADDSASWISTWTSSLSWVSVEGEEVNRNHHHHHHHHHHAHHSKHTHQYDLLWVTEFLIPLITCKLRKKEVLRYLTPTPHQKLFWFGSPGFYLYLCHLATFWQATLIALVIGAFFGFITVHLAFPVIGAVLSLWNLLYYMPQILYHYSFCLNVGEYSKHEFIREVHAKKDRPNRFTKQESKARDRAESFNGFSSESESDRDHSTSSPSPRFPVDMAELRKNQDETLKKNLPVHPRIRNLVAPPGQEESLSTLLGSPQRYSSSESE